MDINTIYFTIYGSGILFYFYEVYYEMNKMLSKVGAKSKEGKKKLCVKFFQLPSTKFFQLLSTKFVIHFSGIIQLQENSVIPIKNLYCIC